MKTGMFFLGVLVIIGVVIGLVVLIWHGVTLLPINVVRIWALLATALLPFVAWVGWYFGHTEARGRLAGIDQAVDKVMGAATKAAGLGVSTRRALRRQEPLEPYVVLPEVEIIPRRLSSGEETIEL